jgi:hypothetical protein
LRRRSAASLSPVRGVLPGIFAALGWVRPLLKEEKRMATPERRGGIGGISLGGILVIVGIVLMIVWSFWGGLIVALIGLIAFGGFARGRWY